jgi:uncharacterized protein (DUF4213/DUF364 family)
MAASESPLEAAIGMAAINSLIEIDTERCIELNAGELLARKGEGKRVAIVGHFPFVSHVRAAAGELWVFEKNPREGDIGEDEEDRFLPLAEVVAITGNAFTNHTLERLLGLCNRDAYVMMVGDTAPLSPLLFDHGISAIAGTRVVDPEMVLRCVSQGATFRQVRGVKRLIMEK